MDALLYYAEQVQKQPEELDLRLDYANTLRMLGYHQEAEGQYRLVLERDETEPQALLNLAVFHGKREEKAEATSYLLRLVELD